MIETSPEIVIQPMTREMTLWRCLHDGPLDGQTLDAPTHPGVDWPALQERNIPLLRRLVAEYGSCAMLAWHGDRVVGMLRFYPRAICDLPDAGHMCLQQMPPNGPSPDLVRLAWPVLDQFVDRTLVVHCLMTGSPKAENNPYQRRGLGTRLVRALEAWARDHSWQAIQATAYPDLPIVYEITGQAGAGFWLKLGYQVADTSPVPELASATQETSPEGGHGGYLGELLDQAQARGMSAQEATRQFTMHKVL